MSDNCSKIVKPLNLPGPSELQVKKSEVPHFEVRYQEKTWHIRCWMAGMPFDEGRSKGIRKAPNPVEEACCRLL